MNIIKTYNNSHYKDKYFSEINIDEFNWLANNNFIWHYSYYINKFYFHNDYEDIMSCVSDNKEFEKLIGLIQFTKNNINNLDLDTIFKLYDKFAENLLFLYYKHRNDNFIVEYHKQILFVVAFFQRIICENNHTFNTKSLYIPYQKIFRSGIMKYSWIANILRSAELGLVNHSIKYMADNIEAFIEDPIEGSDNEVNACDYFVNLGLTDGETLYKGLKYEQYNILLDSDIKDLELTEEELYRYINKILDIIDKYEVKSTIYTLYERKIRSILNYISNMLQFKNFDDKYIYNRIGNLFEKYILPRYSDKYTPGGYIVGFQKIAFRDIMYIGIFFYRIYNKTGNKKFMSLAEIAEESYYSKLNILKECNFNDIRNNDHLKQYSIPEVVNDKMFDMELIISILVYYLIKKPL